MNSKFSVSAQLYLKILMERTVIKFWGSTVWENYTLTDANNSGIILTDNQVEVPLLTLYPVDFRV
ncbi:MAG TPA: hypothetical protein VFD00_12850 [Thermoclostridium sp.]|nr:hypothetical protein [Thermoclostridium sp.]